MQVGEMEIIPVIDGTSELRLSAAFGNMPEEAWGPHRQLLTTDGHVAIDFGGFLIRCAERLVLVDAGVGPDSHGFAASPSVAAFEAGRMLDSLAALGVAPGDITDVILTHLHFDHVGWTTRSGRVVFSNATYRCDQRDWDHFVGPDPGATKKLSPLEGHLATFDHGGPVLPGIDLLSAPGHTPGSTVVVVSSGAERAMLLGDVVHCPVELLEEEWDGIADVDPVLAKRTRNALARELEGTDTPVAAAHFPGLEFGRLLGGRGKRQWVVP